MAYNKTIYRIDYIPKSINNLKENIEKNKLKNIIHRDPVADTYKNYLLIEGDEPVAYSEEINGYFDKAKNNYPWFGKITANEHINQSIVKRSRIFKGRTVYQVDYCDIDKDIAYKEYMARTAIKLPLDVIIPLTSQNAGYRNPKMLDSKVYNKSVQPRPQNSLDKDDKLREILNVKTGDSEYMGIIGKTGEQIMEEELLGIRERYKY